MKAKTKKSGTVGKVCKIIFVIFGKGMILGKESHPEQWGNFKRACSEEHRFSTTFADYGLSALHIFKIGDQNFEDSWEPI